MRSRNGLLPGGRAELLVLGVTGGIPVTEERRQGFRADRPGLRDHVEGEPLNRGQPLVGQRLGALEAYLRTMVPQGRFRLDVPGWFGT
jgi:hypothetical protein